MEKIKAAQILILNASVIGEDYRQRIAATLRCQ